MLLVLSPFKGKFKVGFQLGRSIMNIGREHLERTCSWDRCFEFDFCFHKIGNGKKETNGRWCWWSSGLRACLLLC